MWASAPRRGCWSLMCAALLSRTLWTSWRSQQRTTRRSLLSVPKPGRSSTSPRNGCGVRRLCVSRPPATSAEQTADRLQDVAVERAFDVSEKLERLVGATEERTQGPGELRPNKTEQDNPDVQQAHARRLDSGGGRSGSGLGLPFPWRGPPAARCRGG